MNISDFFTNALDLMNQHGVFEKDYHLELDRSKSRLGLCNHTKKKITISKNFVEQQDWDVIKNTVLHEIAHALVGPNHGHNHVWRQQAMAIGCNGMRCSNVKLDVPAKYEAFCAGCDKVVGHYHRKPKYLNGGGSYTHKTCGSSLEIKPC